MKDLTSGSPGRVLFLYTLPLFGSIVFQQMYSIADSFVAGRYIGTDALAAVGNSYEVTLICIALAFGCNIGASVVTAHLFGEGKRGLTRTCITTALIFAAALGVAVSLAGWLTGGTLLQAMQTPEAVMLDSQRYLNIYLLGFPFLILYQVTNGLCSALGDSRTPFWFLAVSSVSNIIMDIWFVRDLGMGVAGVAWATFLCQSVCGTAAVGTLLWKLRSFRGDDCTLFSWPLLKRMLRIAVPSAIQQSCISVGNILIQIVINGFGTACMAGYAAGVKLNNMCITSVTALGNGMSNYTSQNLGAGRKERIAPGLLSGVMLGMAMGLLFTIVFQLLAPWLTAQFIADGNERAIADGVSFLRIVTPFYMMIAIKLMVDGVLRGAAQMNPFMLATMTDLVLRVVLAFIFSWLIGSCIGVWWAWPIGWAMGVVLSVCFTMRWMKANGCMK